MTKDNTVASIYRRVPWSLLGCLIGITFGLFGIYTVFFYAKAPEVRAEIESVAPVISLRENVQELDIMFKGQNIREAHKALTLVSLKLINRGNVPVKPGDFDQKDLLSLLVRNGELVRSDILDTSEPYLQKVFAESTTTNQGIKFPPFIMEPGHFISFRLLLLHNENVHPTLELTGKIANVPTIPVVEAATDVGAPTKGSIAFSGDFVVQFIRVAAYGLGTLAVLAGVLALVAAIGSHIEKSKERGRRLITQMRVQEFLESLPAGDRDAVEPVAITLVTDDRMVRRQEIMPEQFRWDTQSEELGQDFHFLMLLDAVSRRYPHFNRDYFLCNKSGLTNLSRVLKIIEEGRRV